MGCGSLGGIHNFPIGLHQHPELVKADTVSCELLSNCTFALVFNSAKFNLEKSWVVVNCFQIVLSHWSSTAMADTLNWEGLL